MKDFFDAANEDGVLQASLKKIYNEADVLFDKRFTFETKGEEGEEQKADAKIQGIDAKIEEFTIKMKEVDQELKKAGEQTDQKKELSDPEIQKMICLTKGNILLRKGQCEDEWLLDSRESYQKAVQQLMLAYEPEKETPTDLLIRLELAKFLRNSGKHRRKDDYEYAYGEFAAIKDCLDRKMKEEDLNRREIHLWLDTWVNMGRAKKNLYELDAAGECFWKILRLLASFSNKDQIPLRMSQKGFGGEWSKGQNPAGQFGRMKELGTFSRVYILQVLIQLGIVYRKKREYEKAEKLFDLTIEIDENNTDAENNRAVCYRKNGNLDAAKKEFSRLKERGNRFAEVNLLKCRLQSEKDDLEAAEFDAYLEKNENDREILLLKGMFYEKREKWEEARKIFEELYQREPFLEKGSYGLKAYYNLAKCLLEQQKILPAQKILERILEECQGDELAEISYGWCLMKAGNYKKAVLLYRKLEAGESFGRLGRKERMIIRNNLGECCLHLKRRKEAEQQFEKVLEEESFNTQALCFLAQCGILKAEKQKGNLTAIKEQYEKALRYLAKAQEINRNDTYINSCWMNGNAAFLRWVGDRDTSYKKHAESFLKAPLYFPDAAYSLNACLNFIHLVETWDEKQNGDMPYRMLSRLRLGEKEEGYGAFRHLLDHSSFRRTDAALRGKALAVLYRLYGHVAGMKEICRYSLDMSDSEAMLPQHYTKLSTLKVLLSQEKEEEIQRLRLWNSVYMNDPLEGANFISLMEHLNQDVKERERILEKYFRHTRGDSTCLNPKNRNVYITSFSEHVDDMGMWIAYGDNAAGCAVTFRDEFFDIRRMPEDGRIVSLYNDEDYPLYRVQYLDWDRLNQEGGEPEEIRRQMEKIWECLRQLEMLLMKDGFEEDVKEVIRTFVTDSLDEIRFLFKNPEYDHEKEMRMVKCSYSPKTDEKAFAVPRLYIEVERELQMKQVLLGVKMTPDETDEIVSWLYATGKVEKVKKSKLPYK